MTATNRVSFDTNILMYSIDLRDMEKHTLCSRIVRRCGQIGGVVNRFQLSPQQLDQFLA